MRAALIRILALLMGLAAIGLSPSAHAQVDDRPSTERPVLPEPGPPVEPGLTLPPLPTPEAGPGRALSFVVRGFDFAGHTAFTAETLRALLADYVGRRVDSADLLEARDRITRAYIEAGYVTSGAILPDQDLEGGRVRFEIVEGRLGEIEVKGTRRFRPDFFRRRVERIATAPLDVARLEGALRRFQQDALVERVAARLEPTEQRGVSRLVLVIEEARQADVRIGAENDRSPAVGEEGGVLRASIANLLGRRDELSTTATVTSGLYDVGGRYAMPLNAWDTRLELAARWSSANVVEYPFRPLDIESESLTLSMRLMQPVWSSRRVDVELGLGFDWRRGRSTQDERLFCFQPEVTDCTPTAAVLRALSSIRYRDTERVLALRSTLSWGNGWLGATTTPGTAPDGRFFAWLLQAQLAHRAPLESLLVARFDLQLTEDALLAFERIAVGGARTVRGYRPNQLVRDSGLAGSLEWRVPVWKRPLGDPYVELAPFWDVGYAWNERLDPGDNLISSLGMGLVMRPHERIDARLDWGGRMLGVERVGNGLIDLGIHFRVEVDVW